MIRRARGRHRTGTPVAELRDYLDHIANELGFDLPRPVDTHPVRGRHRLADGGTPVSEVGGYVPTGNAIDLPAEPDRNVTDWLAQVEPAIWAHPLLAIPDGPVGVVIDSRVHISDPNEFDPPEDSPYARMCQQLDDMQPTIRQLTQKV
ncbi:hypothetical protein SEA_TWISTER6_78 [Gordonia phage Twister6]|uniref:Uncharacterized protein n=3 Tax=Wizardvirus TaxID=2169658 RepID=A0A6M3T2K6_9CAUD|nr:hypothetical protein BI083_gp78 [Gordonia phage Twister6]YP_010102040.1 hypothetical protein KNU53_gp78 [Gordonia phage SmokingBunny]YP_010107713.1 hypothetical protein KNV01_gp77 [Gordonia phage Evamon]UVK62399.1 hypothetical protein SEA_SALVADOR_77 [Gordonia phage Salvador]WAA20295.1 hypothetical protein SEA_TOGO_77 [Gordonia phage Togo]AOE44987.1 hypothetical protein SEA_TWISTER6_78 [Gordonia phage Twister6]QCG77889.1 hypothetical protein SEA_SMOKINGBUNNY_78 [Gordonia phage SmokingBunny